MIDWCWLLVWKGTLGCAGEVSCDYHEVVEEESDSSAVPREELAIATVLRRSELLANDREKEHDKCSALTMNEIAMKDEFVDLSFLSHELFVLLQLRVYRPDTLPVSGPLSSSTRHCLYAESGSKLRTRKRKKRENDKLQNAVNIVCFEYT